jgi:hypothetical protein
MLNNIYCIDSSALIDFQKYYGQKLVPSLWNKLDLLFDNNLIFSHEIVFEELTSKAKIPSPLSKWIEHKKSYFKKMSLYQANCVSKIVKTFPNLIEPLAEKDQADPWLIALVMEERENPTFFTSGKNIVVVSQESKQSDSKIPAVCHYFNILHFDIPDFITDNGWEIKVE